MTCEERWREVSLLSWERRRGGEGLWLWPSGAQLLAGESAESDSSQRCREKDKGNGHKLQQGKFHLLIKKKKIEKL